MEKLVVWRLVVEKLVVWRLVVEKPVEWWVVTLALVVHAGTYVVVVSQPTWHVGQPPIHICMEV